LSPSPNSRANLTIESNQKEPYIPVTVLNMGNQKHFNKISSLINNTYEAQQQIKGDFETRKIKRQLAIMGD